MTTILTVRTWKKASPPHFALTKATLRCAAAITDMGWFEASKKHTHLIKGIATSNGKLYILVIDRPLALRSSAQKKH